MKTHSASARTRGFTLMELMVAMAITTIIVTVLVSITSVAMDTWNRSRAELRAARQAKSLIDTMARDFESLVTRSGNNNQWLSATSSDPIGGQLKSSNASELIFFSAVTDRYNGQVGNTIEDKGGDVSCVAYRLQYRDPIDDSSSAEYKTFILNRLLVNPDETFQTLLGQENLQGAFNTSFSGKLSEPQNFVCENIFQFTVTFHVQVTDTTATPPVINVHVPVKIGQANSSETTTSFKIMGNGIITGITGGAVTSAQLAAGRLTAMEVSVTVISDFGIDQLRTRTFSGTQQSEFLNKHSYQYSKLVHLPSM